MMTLARTACVLGRGTLGRLLRHRSFVIGAVLFGAMLLLALLAPWLGSGDPNKMAVRLRFRPPSWDFPLGTDNLGRSMLSRVLHGGQLSLVIGFWVVALNALFGVFLGAVAGYFSKLDGPLMRLADALMAFPSVLLAIGIAAALGPSPTTVVIALAVVYIPRTARILRASVLVVRELDYVHAARVAGASHWHILCRHILGKSGRAYIAMPDRK